MSLSLGQIMLYVNDQQTSLQFWIEKIGFKLIAENDEGDFKWYEVASSEQTETTIVLQDKQTVAKMSPELNLGTPSLMFYTTDIEKLYQTYKNKEITVGELVEMPFGKVFNFADNEENYFAVMEKN
ncbi:VOC family protein [Cytobacillus sp. FSL M8-0252]|uniref:Glyoxalase/bleomycin resistance/extradiol dioxygenase family protein n=2 Tax=Bacillaceae TaxID=186817 RepID=A0A248THZ6_9BACI|nr:MULTISPECIES: VOC family protein [Cytobacillus]ASV67828.1 glyoxalase/bleomycin resistance/extradiol dioxygenase family protein [Cytobacillus kochii]MEA1853919.1 VOC family protein [Cytobacillus sp. OWB-43]